VARTPQAQRIEDAWTEVVESRTTRRELVKRTAVAGAALAGVPADRRRELEAEVGPVLALLAGTQAECERIITQARLDAGQLVAEAGTEAAAIAADAARRAAAAREEAARRVMAAAGDEAAAAVRDAELQAAGTRELAAQRVPALAGRAVDAIRRLEADGR